MKTAPPLYLEIIKHDGPARLGRLHFEDRVVPAPSLFWSPAAGKTPESYLELSPIGSQPEAPSVISYGTIFSGERIERFGILPSFQSGFDVPEAIALEAVEKTIVFSGKHISFGAVVEGGRYVELRRRCAEALKDRPLLRIADSDRLVKNHRKLVDTVTAIREAANPNTAVYAPGVEPVFFPLLAYMGVDLFDLKRAVLGAHEGLYYTLRGAAPAKDLSELPCPCPVCSGHAPDELTAPLLKEHNINTFTAAVREVRETIRKRELRNLVEERATCHVNAMGALRILDTEKQDFLERYTAIA